MDTKTVGYQNACTVWCAACTDRNARRNKTNPFVPILETDATMIGQECEKCGDVLIPKKETPATSVEAAKRHHAEHGDMDGRTCLLSACALHYPQDA